MTKYTIRWFTGSSRSYPKKPLMSVRPLVPPVVACWPTSQMARAAASA